MNVYIWCWWRNLAARVMETINSYLKNGSLLKCCCWWMNARHSSLYSSDAMVVDAVAFYECCRPKSKIWATHHYTTAHNLPSAFKTIDSHELNGLSHFVYSHFVINEWYTNTWAFYIFRNEFLLVYSRYTLKTVIWSIFVAVYDRKRSEETHSHGIKLITEKILWWRMDSHWQS